MMRTVLALNVSNILKVKEFILAEPQHYEQDVYIKPIHDLLGHGVSMLEERRSLDSEKDTFCGVAHCIAGTAYFLSDPARLKQADKQLDSNIGTATILAAARNWMGLSDIQADILFSNAESWPSPFDDAYYHAKTLQDRAQVAADILDHLISDPAGFENYSDFDDDEEDEFYLDALDDAEDVEDSLDEDDDSLGGC